MGPLAIAGYVSLVASGVVLLLSRLPKQTIANYKDLTASQEKRILILESQHAEDTKMHFENAKAIADLQGQVKIYQGLALETMAKSMADISITNKQILETLKNSAVTLVHDTEAAAQGTQAVAQELKHKKEK